MSSHGKPVRDLCPSGCMHLSCFVSLAQIDSIFSHTNDVVLRMAMSSSVSRSFHNLGTDWNIWKTKKINYNYHHKDFNVPLTFSPEVFFSEFGTNINGFPRYPKKNKKLITIIFWYIVTMRLRLTFEPLIFVMHHYSKISTSPVLFFAGDQAPT